MAELDPDEFYVFLQRGASMAGSPGLLNCDGNDFIKGKIREGHERCDKIHCESEFRDGDLDARINMLPVSSRRHTWTLDNMVRLLQEKKGPVDELQEDDFVF